MNRVSTAGPFQFLAGTSQRRDLEITWALIPALVFHAWAVGIHSIVVLATCLGVSLATAAVSSVAGGKSIAVVAPTGRQLLVLIIPILLLPASAPLWSAIGSILLAIWLLRGVFGAANPVFNPAALALLFFVILSGPGSLPATPDFSAIPIYLLSDGYLQYLWDGEPMAILELRNLLVLAGALILISRSTVSWRVPLAMAVTLALPQLALANPLDAQLSLWLHSELPLFLFFLAPDSRSAPAEPRARLLFGVLLAALFYLLQETYGYIVAMTVAVLAGNLCAPWLEHICTRFSPGGRHGFAIRRNP